MFESFIVSKLKSDIFTGEKGDKLNSINLFINLHIV